MNQYELETIEVQGNPRQLGESQGEALRERIQRFVAMRFDSVDGYFRERGFDGAKGIREMGRLSAAIHAEWDPDGYVEHQGIAAGAGVDANDLYTATNMTDMRDALLLSAASGPLMAKQPEEGCSSLLVPAGRTRDGHSLAGQTWDLNPPDVEYIVAIRRRPNEGPQTWSITCSGCLSLMGFNEFGLGIGTTNIKTYGSRPGVGYLGILHRVIRASNVDEAVELIESAPLAAAHTYWLADEKRLFEWEASPNGCFGRSADEAPLQRTNHCIAPDHVDIQGEAPSESSHRRFDRIATMLSGSEINPMYLRDVFSDRSDGVQSVNRYAEDGLGTATNAILITEPATRRGWACRGQGDRGQWIELDFS